MEALGNNIQIMPATGAEAPLVAGLIANAFHDLDAARWQIPDEHLRRTVLPAIFEGYVRYALGHGSVEVVRDVSAAAVWTIETGAPKPSPEPPSGRMVDALGDATAARVHAFDLALHEREPVGTPFEKLALLAVRPDVQCRGIGSVLLAHHLAGLDRQLIPAYLEASSERSRDLYLHFGFRDHGEPIRLLDGPLMFPMWREPRGMRHA